MARPKLVRQQKQMKEADYELIRHYHETRDWPVQILCGILEISRAAYYKWLHRKPTDREIENEELLKKIEEIARENNRLFGHRKMTKIINENTDKPYNHKRIYNLMCANDLDSVSRKKETLWKDRESSSPDNCKESEIK